MAETFQRIAHPLRGIQNIIKDDVADFRSPWMWPLAPLLPAKIGLDLGVDVSRGVAIIAKDGAGGAWELGKDAVGGVVHGVSGLFD